MKEIIYRQLSLFILWIGFSFLVKELYKWMIVPVMGHGEISLMEGMRIGLFFCILYEYYSNMSDISNKKIDLLIGIVSGIILGGCGLLLGYVIHL